MNSTQAPAPGPQGNVSSNALLPLETTTNLEVELVTAQACVFRGRVKSMKVKMTEGTVDISSPAVTYLNLAHVTELVLWTGGSPVTFELKNAVGSFREGKLTIVAETIAPKFGTDEA